MTLNVYHTQEFRPDNLKFPIMAQGSDQWLGDGFYFWQDYEFSSWWGHRKKCGILNKSRQFSIYSAVLTFGTDGFIDTVFNETDYYNFTSKIESFAKQYTRKFKSKPTLEEFNDFIEDFGLWEEIKVIRFQDVPANNELVSVNDFYYKKRIQIRVNDPSIITTFAHLKNLYCV